MSNPKGNPGNKGGGRKSAYQELKDALDTQAMFFNDFEQEVIEQKIRTGKFSIKDRYILTAMEGDTKILQSISNKVLPDKIDIKGNLTISDVLDTLDGQEISEQTVETESPLQDQKQEGQTDSVQTEPSPSPLQSE